ncbi:hypothetical protein M427DRAFT_43285 [Gonapodya prolifera JEL478]|uniref:HMG box domain-containing protein n=1 Tax=Gonapodya prolifera (strain JEL478) TaxID=1344416 RepID=A0A139AJS9_GONPJ|nr:hypothetical protein M427DRAFT_43285 [Gonapodya prolifera JEL478]|eukprot:KXS17021.1 hypothetical protein M427DRAFT_43285 [Gonapodya prolifera JEL478]
MTALLLRDFNEHSHFFNSIDIAATLDFSRNSVDATHPKFNLVVSPPDLDDAQTAILALEGIAAPIPGTPIPPSPASTVYSQSSQLNPSLFDSSNQFDVADSNPLEYFLSNMVTPPGTAGLDNAALVAAAATAYGSRPASPDLMDAVGQSIQRSLSRASVGGPTARESLEVPIFATSQRQTRPHSRQSTSASRVDDELRAPMPSPGLPSTGAPHLSEVMMTPCHTNNATPPSFFFHTVPFQGMHTPAPTTSVSSTPSYHDMSGNRAVAGTSFDRIDTSALLRMVPTPAQITPQPLSLCRDPAALTQTMPVVRDLYAAAYVLFFGEQRGVVESSYAITTPAEVNKHLLKRWRGMSVYERSAYAERARTLMTDVGGGAGSDSSSASGILVAMDPSGIAMLNGGAGAPDMGMGMQHSQFTPQLRTFPGQYGFYSQPSNSMPSYNNTFDGQYNAGSILAQRSVRRSHSDSLAQLGAPSPYTSMDGYNLTYPDPFAQSQASNISYIALNPPPPSRAHRRRHSQSCSAESHSAVGDDLDTSSTSGAGGPTRSKSTRKSKTRDPTAPKHPRSAYLFFQQEQMSNYPGLSLPARSKMIRDVWYAIPPEEKTVYEELSARDKKRYRDEKEAVAAKSAVRSASAGSLAEGY